MSEKKDDESVSIKEASIIEKTPFFDSSLLKSTGPHEFGSPEWDEYVCTAYYDSLIEEQKALLMEKTGHGVTIASTEKDQLSADLYYLIDKLMYLTDDDVLHKFRDVVSSHADDVNFPLEDWRFINDLVDGQLAIQASEVNFEAKLLAALCYYHSPYPEVRSVTDMFNNPDEYVETIRSYFLAFVFLILGAGVNEFFSHRQPSIALSSSVLSILMYPCGLFLAWIVPESWTLPWFGGERLKFNPGPYSYKEQMFVTLFAGISGNSVYVATNIITQKKFYEQDWVDFGFQILLALSTQCLGLAFAGIMRKFVIYPERAVWPTMLPTMALNRALLRPERKELIHGWKISRYYFFWIAFFLMFVYFWLPNYLFTALSLFNWMTWIAPQNFNLAAITGSVSGLGLNPVPTFDWNTMSYAFPPLATPWNTVWNMYIGSLLGFVSIVGIYYSNYKWTAYLPINSNSIFTNTGETFDVKEVLTNGLFDSAKYQEYSPPFYSAANIVVYAASFAAYPLALINSTFSEWVVVKSAFRMMFDDLGRIFKRKSGSSTQFHDAQSKMMRQYKEVPDWCYFSLLIASFILAVIAVEVFPETITPVWSLALVVGISFLFLIPLSLLFAVNGVQLGLSVLIELIFGYALQGNGMAFAYNIDGQADSFVGALKVGHYAKLAPRAVFRAQMIATFIQAFITVGVMNWSVGNIDGYCETDQAQRFTCPGDRSYYSASVFWGVVGPKVVFSGIYPELQYSLVSCFLCCLFA